MEQPIMQRALGSKWERLGPAVRAHYALMPGKEDRRVMHGRMRISHAPWAKPVLLIGRLFGALIACKGKAIPVRVENWSEQGSLALHWRRAFAFPGAAPIFFRSRMEYLGDEEVIEYVRWGLGIRMRLAEQNGALVYEGTGYQWDVGPLSLPIPDWLLLGKARIREWSIDEDRFAMEFRIRHPLLGEAFSYEGEFQLAPRDAD